MILVRAALKIVYNKKVWLCYGNCGYYVLSGTDSFCGKPFGDKYKHELIHEFK